MPTLAKPAITIVTPSYNRAWAIGTCIESLQQQVGIQYEHLIIDGGSTDGTLGILEAAAAADQRIRFISEPDAGMYDAVNKGMRMASADVVAYLNTDDFYLPGALAHVLEAFARRPDVSMVYGHWMSWYPESGFVEMLPVLRYTATDMALFAVLPQPSVFFRRSVFEKIGDFDLSYKLLADNEFFSRAVASGFTCIRIDAYLSAQTIHSGNLLAGNAGAILQAHEEGVRYRSARRVELARSNSQEVRPLSYAASTTKKALLPLVWRFNLLYCIVRGVIAGRATHLAPWGKIDGDWSVLSLMRYLFSRGGRQQQGFFKVAPAKLAVFLGFTPPLPPVKARNKTSSPKP
jgi:glycosyltransferase involved in cell wall biosynthesis